MVLKKKYRNGIVSILSFTDEITYNKREYRNKKEIRHKHGMRLNEIKTEVFFHQAEIKPTK